MPEDKRSSPVATSSATVGMTTDVDPQENLSAEGKEPLVFRRSTPNILLFLLAILLIGILPFILYGRVFIGLPTVNALEARQRLTASRSTAILVDIRDPEAFDEGHVSGSQNWPYQDILQIESTDELPEALGDHELLLLSEAGLNSAPAARHLVRFSIPAYHIHGGMQSWIATATKPEGEILSSMEIASGEGAYLPTRSVTLGEQYLTVAATFMIKPVYMVATLLLILALWANHAPDLAALRWGLIFFLAGETACVINTFTYFTTGEQSDLFEYLHGLGMVLCLWFVVYALIEGLDRRLVNLSHPRRRCAMLPLCRECVKTQDVACGLKRAFLFTIPTIAALTLIPLSANLEGTSYNVSLLGFLYNFTHPGIHQFYEIRYLPVVALSLFTIAFSILLLKKEDAMALAKIPFAAGAGVLVYSLLMLALYAMYRHNMVWFVFWEEGTELLLIAAISAVLWVFRRGFFPRGQTLIS